MHARARDAGLWSVLIVICWAVSFGEAIPVYAQGGGTAEGEQQQGKVPTGLSVPELFESTIHFIHIGRYKIATQYAAALLASQPDPDELLKLTEEPRLADAFDWLVRVSSNETVGQNAKAILALIKKGEFHRRTDPAQIVAQFKRLAKSERAFVLATDWLRNSGEYAVPQAISILRDPEQKDLHPLVVRALAELGKSAVNPLVIALSMDDPVVNEFVAQVLGRIGYPQAVPYLGAIVAKKDTAPLLKEAARKALEAIAGADRAAQFSGDEAVAKAFYGLAEKYYYDAGSLRADRQYDFANVWYWSEDEGLQRVEVATEAFNEIMAMRCCEIALAHKPDYHEAIALWLAADARREVALAGQPDKTRPSGFPPAAFFANLSGARYNHMVVARGFRDRDSTVMLAGIRALQATAGPASLTGPEELKQPLVQALRYPDRVVRYEAALAIANALPQSEFDGYDMVLPVLVEALGGTGVNGAVVIDGRENRLNATAGLLQEIGYRVARGSDPEAAIEQANRTLSSVDVVVIASDTIQPNMEVALGRLQNHPRLLGAPIIIMADPSAESAVARTAGRMRGVVAVPADISKEALPAKIEAGNKQVGRLTLDAEQALVYARRAAEALLLIARSNNPTFDINLVRGGILRVLKESDREPLRISVAGILSLLDYGDAQRQIADLALAADNTPTLRAAMYKSLSASAGRFGNLLEDEQVAALIKSVNTEGDNILRTAAAQALGALNLPDNRASEIIRGMSRDVSAVGGKPPQVQASAAQ